MILKLNPYLPYSKISLKSEMFHTHSWCLSRNQSLFAVKLVNEAIT